MSVTVGTARFTEETVEYMDSFLERTRYMNKTAREDLPHDIDRVAEVDAMIREHEVQTGREPDTLALHRLANYLLAEHLKDPSPDKITQNDFPILSNNQIRRRMRTQLPMENDTMDFLQSKIHRRMDSLARVSTPKAEY